MARLCVHRGTVQQTLDFTPPIALGEALTQLGLQLPHPCGGGGRCGKCAAEVCGCISPPTPAEVQAGTRLSCQVTLLGDACVTLPAAKAYRQIAGTAATIPAGGTGLGVALDIGTTTLALTAWELSTGTCLGSAAMENPQTQIAADVMGRIGAALAGQRDPLREQLLGAISQLLEAVSVAPESITAMVAAGNTTMLYLLTGRDPECLSHAPFAADTLFDCYGELPGIRAYLPPCMNAFVGADITCAVLASGICQTPGPHLLCDIGTNGEIALWKDGVLYVTSTAAGPAFEGAGITQGCGSIDGAIDRVWTEMGRLCVHTIADRPAAGICGSGLIDAVAALLELEQIDETGATEADVLELRDGIALYPRDIRNVQLAKAAIAAGIQTLCQAAGVTCGDIHRFCIAGGFGSHLNRESAARIGLIPSALKDRAEVLGNGALAGAALLLQPEFQAEARAIAQSARFVSLGGNPVFNENYMENMFFPEGEADSI